MSKVITSKNAGTCTAFELRQELVKRGAFDIPEEKVNFKSLLQRLMVELVAEESRNTEARTQAIADETAAKLEQAKQDRERKKQEALERSKARQADPNYFKQRAEKNEEAVAAKAKAVEEAASQPSAGATENENEEEEGEGEDSKGDDDPFRTYKSKGRSKVFVK